MSRRFAVVLVALIALAVMASAAETSAEERFELVESTSDAAAVHVADFLEMSSSHKRLTNEELEKELKRHSQSGTKCLIIRRYVPGSRGKGPLIRDRVTLNRALDHFVASKDSRLKQLCQMWPCVTSPWSWSKCDDSCTQKGTRTVVWEPRHGAPKCPSLTGSQSCTDSPKCQPESPSTGKVSTGSKSKSERSAKRVSSVSVKVDTSSSENSGRVPARDCQMGQWSAWSACSTSCGGGHSVRTRRVKVTPTKGGKPCGNLHETQKCNTQACDAACGVSAWSKVSECSRQCGGGKQTRTRTIDHPGDNCPTETSITRACNTKPCDCQVSQWSEPSKCSVQCGGGIARQRRSVIRAPTRGGVSCGSLHKSVPCNTQACPQECGQISAWSAWSKCSKSCGGGFQKQTRTIESVVAGVCDKLVQKRACNTRSCDGKVSAWSSWSECSTTCGGGVQVRRRTIIQAPSKGGSPVGKLVQTRKCNTEACPSHCGVSAWSQWTLCSKKCGGGKQMRTREIENRNAEGCPSQTADYRACNTKPCACQLSKWSKWSECSSSCDGLQQRRRRILVRPTRGGVGCGKLQMSRPCGGACPAECGVSAWSSWSKCSVKCGGGKQTRTRTIANMQLENCPHNIQDTRACNTKPCDCQVSQWSKWSQCSSQCGGGTRRRRRSVLVQPTRGGRGCGALRGVEACNVGACDAECQVSAWSTWSVCSKKCGGGVQTRTRTIGNPDLPQCPSLLTDKRACNSFACDCVVSPWSSWSECSARCGGGVQQHRRKALRQPSRGGRACPKLLASRSCNMKACPAECGLISAWSKWSKCSKKCGGGVSKRTRSIENPVAGVCDETVATRTCNLKACDCQMSAWTSWTVCSSACNGGTQRRSRYVKSQPSRGGRACGKMRASRACNTQLCPEECGVSLWSDWSACSRSCGGGVQKRTRTIAHPEVDGCPKNTVDKRPCGTKPCDCRVSGFSDWSKCSVRCGGGVQHRSRRVRSAPTRGGRSCPQLYAARKCNTQSCPDECGQISAWSSWSKCSRKCGGGVQKRIRSIENVIVGVCDEVSVTRRCNSQPCDCKLSQWSDWSECSSSCGGGSRRRSRKVLSQPSRGGRGCGILRASEACNKQACPAECGVSEWSAFGECSKSCGGGKMVRTRTIAHPEHEGCPQKTTDVRTCHSKPCNCKVSEWSSYSHCSVRCGGGVQSSKRSILVVPSKGGRTCPSLIRRRKCGTGACPDECGQISAWSAWSKCSRKCGGGVQKQTRSIENIVPGLCDEVSHTRKCNTRACDCKLSSWSTWSACSSSCDGIKTRKRFIKASPSKGGRACGKMRESKSCNKGPKHCSSECGISKWSAWSKCSAKCGRGVQTRSRTIEHPGLEGCPSETVQSRVCQNKPCDCKLSEWSSWSRCSSACQGIQTRRRRVLTTPTRGGASCSKLVATRKCGGTCAPECEVSKWSSWSKCSAKCGGGKQIRTRTIGHPELPGCPTQTSDSRKCNTRPCDCKVGSWSAWSQCSSTCGGGISTRKRVVLTQPSKGGKSCPRLYASRPCNKQACDPQCGHVSAWSAWTSCSKKCGGGVQTQSRTIESPIVGVCDVMIHSRRCNTAPCDCKLSEWSEFSPCSSSCGGSTFSKRSVLSAPSRGGRACGALFKSRRCNTGPVHCDSKCGISRWSEWSACSASCGGGVRTRTRFIEHPELDGCPTDVKESRPCASKPCDCVVGAWQPFGKCSAQCGGGERYRRRLISRPATAGGRPCSQTLERQTCAKKACAVECGEVSPWSIWSKCSKPRKCGQRGKQTRTRSIENPVAGVCDQTVHTRPCGAPKVCTKERIDSQFDIVSPARRKNVDCELGAWSCWSKCSSTCNGMQHRFRSVLVSPKGKGASCGELKQSRSCGSKCPSDCSVSAWSAWSECSKKCGGGVQTRSRTIGSSASHCPTETTVYRSCNTQACDCVLSEWSKPTRCSSSCAGTSTSTRKVLQSPTRGGRSCGPLLKTVACNVGAKACPTPCGISTWSEWSTCSRSCGGGFQTRTRTIATPQLPGCPTQTKEQRKCNSNPCNCVVGEWNAWSRCSSSCDGTSRRTRSVKVAPTPGGRLCPSLVVSQPCNSGPSACSSKCGISGWSAWSKCSAKCGGGKQTRTRSIANPTLPGCNVASKDSRPCNTQACDCQLSAWTSWSSCSSSCRGTQYRTRKVVSAPSRAGQSCGALRQSRACNTAASNCPNPCGISKWTTWTRCSRKCGGGVQTRTRTIANPEQAGCPSETVDKKRCNTRPCDCIMSSWSSFTRCSSSCHGLKTRKRFIKASPSKGGRACGKLRQTVSCNTGARHCNSDCGISKWSAWSKCSAKCGTKGRQVRSRTIQHPEHDNCPSETTQVRPCNAKPCDCKVGAWTAWTQCSVTCGGGVRTRRRVIKSQPSRGGRACPALRASKPCNKRACDARCGHISKWSSWSACSSKCGNGWQVQKRTIESPIAGVCDQVSQRRPCGRPCDCKVSSWTKWSSCSSSCNGIRTRSRKVLSSPSRGGRSCGALRISAPCNQGRAHCDSRCGVGKWSAWSRCSARCGGGIQKRARFIERPELRQCPKDMTQTRKCNTAPCDCKVSAWSEYSRCSSRCQGQKRRSRVVAVRSTRGGRPCPLLQQVKSCGGKCPSTCGVSAWSSQWSACSARCGGWQTKSRTILHPEVDGCPKSLTMKRKCSQRACHCKMTKWSSWSTCSTRCGGGVQYKSRQILAKPSAGGRACGRTSRHRLCNMHDCAPECGVSAWSAWSDCSKACGGGVRVQTRTIGNSKLEHCPTNTKQKKACNTQQCHCVLSQWSPWSKCDGVCGSGAVQSRKRFPLAGSKDCKDYDLTQTRSCPNQPPCPAQCEVSSWSKFSTTCSRSCGGGVFKQTRFVNGPEAICGDVVSEQTKPCNQHACPHRADLRRIVAAVRQMSKRTRTSSEAFAEFMAEALKVSGGNSNSQSRFRNRVSERNCAKLYPVFTR